MDYIERTYRKISGSDDLVKFEVKIKESDLMLLAPFDFRKEAETYLLTIRSELEDFIRNNEGFLYSMTPYRLSQNMPPLALLMATASAYVGVGPMASVAGAIAELVGRNLLEKLPEDKKEVIVENGGDIFIFTKKERRALIFAGGSPLSNRIAIKIKRLNQPLGLCTSSATVGPSKSFGITDACVILSNSAALSDAAATAFGNMVKKKEDMENAVDKAMKLPSIIGVVIIVGDRMAVGGDIEIEAV